LKILMLKWEKESLVSTEGKVPRSCQPGTQKPLNPS
jgi:hypothetical protein